MFSLRESASGSMDERYFYHFFERSISLDQSLIESIEFLSYVSLLTRIRDGISDAVNSRCLSKSLYSESGSFTDRVSVHS
jgi:hypothetical protein